METGALQKTIQNFLRTGLPKGQQIASEGRCIAGQISIGRTRFLSEMGFASEADYKRHCMLNNKIMYHAHIGMSSWSATADALIRLYGESKKMNFSVDRFGLCLERRMGLPKSHRAGIPAETGPMLESKKDWTAVAQTVPIQPHLGDFMIGFPAARDNTVMALEEGITSIGNLSQFFSHEVPDWNDHVTTTVETVKAIALLGSLRSQGTMLHSYLEDGYGALFLDCATVAGWAYLERYIVEDLLGAKLSHCIGGLTSDPVKRAGWVFAMNDIHNNDCLGTMFYGDTISFTRDLTRNNGLVSEYLLWDILAQLECPTGHAVHPLPSTEGIRVPSVEEIIEAQNLGRRVEESARRLHPHIDFSSSKNFAAKMVDQGKKVCDNALQGLKEFGVDIADAVQLLYVLKKIGPAAFEQQFGVGKKNLDNPRGRDPLVMTDIFKRSNEIFEDQRDLFHDPVNQRLLKGKRLLIASSDVHEHAIILLNQLCREAGALSQYLGAEKSASEVALAAANHPCDAILISTHNGMALEYARLLKAELKKNNIDIPVMMGGLLNQKVEGKQLPVDVTTDLARLGFVPHGYLKTDFRKLLESENTRT
ncbi:MAG: hypothetical protein RQ739_13125 [Desulfotignum sp.]|nr:hypothetical protein [Desulfotignum sp.]